MMTTATQTKAISHDTTDTQIAVRACLEHGHQLPPDLAVLVANVSRHYASLPPGGWPETKQAELQMAEVYSRLTPDLALAIAATDKRMVEAREINKVQHYAESVIVRGRPIVDSLAKELTRVHGDYRDAINALDAAYPEIPARDREILATAAVRQADR